MPEESRPVGPRTGAWTRRRTAAAPPEKKPPMLPFSFRRFLTIVAVLLVANYLFVAIFAPAEERKRVPYTPVFIEQIEKGNVKEISSKGSTVQGEFKKEVKGSKKFETEVPTFADTDELSRDLEKERRHGERQARGGPLAAGDAAVLVRPDAADRRACSSS